MSSLSGESGLGGHRARERVPTGFRELDKLLDGGMPRGSFVLLSGELGAGAPEFAYTGAAILSMASTDPETFELHYGAEVEEGKLPEETHLISVTRDLRDTASEMASVLSDEMMDALSERLQFTDFSEAYFHKTPVPRSWVTDEEVTLRNLAERRSREEELLPDLARYLELNAPGNLVVISSLTSLVLNSRRRADGAELLSLLEGIQKASKRWGGIIYALLDRGALEEREYRELASVSDGVLQFEWTGETRRNRNLYLHSLRGVMGELSDKAVRFESEVTEEGYRISSRERIQ